MDKLSKSFIVLLIIAIAVTLVYHNQKQQFNQRINTRFVQQEHSFPYYLKPGKRPYALILGDLNGLNKSAYQALLTFTARQYPRHSSLIVVPSLIPKKTEMIPDSLQREDFLHQVSNARGVVLVDNFCTENWPSLKVKPLYQNSALSPGVFCFSEPQTQDLQRLIKRFRVKNVFLVYDSEHYKQFIANFLQYLKEHQISYQFVQTKDVSEIEKQI